jgi:hypothetical protein
MLSNRDDVLLYLMNERGLSPETILERELGFVGSGWSLTGSLPADFTREQLAQTGLVWRDGPRAGKDYFYNHLLIPITARGHVIQIRGRAWGEVKGAKYMSGPGEAGPRLQHRQPRRRRRGHPHRGRVRRHPARRGPQGLPEDAPARSPSSACRAPTPTPTSSTTTSPTSSGSTSASTPTSPASSPPRRLREKYGARARVLALPNTDGRKADWTEYLLPRQDRRGFDIEHPYAGHDATDVLRLMSQASGKRIHSVAEAGAAFRTYRATNTGLQTGWHQLDAVHRPRPAPRPGRLHPGQDGNRENPHPVQPGLPDAQAPHLFISLEMTREEVYHRLARIYWHHHPDASSRGARVRLSQCVDLRREPPRRTRPTGARQRVRDGERRQAPTSSSSTTSATTPAAPRGTRPYEKTTNAAMQLKADAKAGRLVIISPARSTADPRTESPSTWTTRATRGADRGDRRLRLAAYRPDAALSPKGIVNVSPPGSSCSPS